MIDTKALRKRILDLAIHGKLTQQLDSDGTAEDLYQQIQAEKQKLVKEKTIPPIKSEEIPFDIPSNWKWYRFGDVVSFHLGKTPERGNRTYWKDGVYNWITISDMPQTGRILSTNEKISQKACDDCFTCDISKAGTLIMSFKLSIGKVAILDIDSYHNEAIISIYPFYDEKEQFRNYLFTMLPLISKMTDSHGAIKGETLNKKSLAFMKVPLPPLAEQKRIVERVEEIFGLLDTIDEAQEKYSADSASLRSKLITAGIQGKLTQQLPSDGTAEELYQQIQAEKQKLISEGKIKKEKRPSPITDEEIPFVIPDNWKWVRLNELTEKITSGSTPEGGKKGNAYVKEGYCFFREQNIYNDGIHNDGMVYISEELLDTRENSTVLPNDILLNITGGSIGRCAIIPAEFSKGSINQHILIIRLINKEMLHYIHDLLCSPYYQKIINNKVVGDKDGFSGGRCKDTLIPLPPLNEQKRIAEALERILEIF